MYESSGPLTYQQYKAAEQAKDGSTARPQLELAADSNSDSVNEMDDEIEATLTDPWFMSRSDPESPWNVPSSSDVVVKSAA